MCSHTCTTIVSLQARVCRPPLSAIQRELLDHLTSRGSVTPLTQRPPKRRRCTKLGGGAQVRVQRTSAVKKAKQTRGWGQRRRLGSTTVTVWVCRMGPCRRVALWKARVPIWKLFCELVSSPTARPRSGLRCVTAMCASTFYGKVQERWGRVDQAE